MLIGHSTLDAIIHMRKYSSKRSEPFGMTVVQQLLIRETSIFFFLVLSYQFFL